MKPRLPALSGAVVSVMTARRLVKIGLGEGPSTFEMRYGQRRLQQAGTAGWLTSSGQVVVFVLNECLNKYCDVVQDIWPHLTNLKWIHSASAGVEKLLFPELVKSSVTVTNAKVSFTVPAIDVLQHHGPCYPRCSVLAQQHFTVTCIK